MLKLPNFSNSDLWLIDAIGNPIIVTDLEGKILFWNKASEHFYEWESTEVVGNNILSITVPNENLTEGMEILHLLSNGESWKGTFKVRKKSGKIILAEISDFPIFDNENNIIGIIGVTNNISEIIEKSQLLEENLIFYENVLNQIPYPAALLNTDFVFQYANEEYLKNFSKGGKIFGKKISLVFGEEFFNKRKSLLTSTLSGESQRFEFETETPDGINRWFDVFYKPFRVNSEIVGVLISAIEITKRKEREMNLIEKENLISDISKNMPGILYQFRIDSNGKTVFPYISDSCLEYFGYSSSEVLQDGSILVNAVYNEDKENFNKSVKESLENIEPYSLRHRIVKKDGSIIWVDANSIPKRKRDGSVEWTGVAIDITKQKIIEDELEEKRFIYNQLFENIGTGVAVYKAIDNGDDFTFLEMNKAGEKLAKVSIEKIRNKKFTEVFPKIEKTRLFETLRKVYISGFSKHIPFQNNSEGEIEQLFENYIFKLPSGLIVDIFDDSTEKKTLIDKLVEREEQLSTLLEASPDIIIVKDGKGRWLFANKSNLELFDLTNFDYKLKTDLELSDFVPQHKDSLINCIITDEETWSKKSIFVNEEFVIDKIGNYRTFEVIKSPIFDSSGRRKALVVIGRDVTERNETLKALKQNEELLKRAEQLSHLGSWEWNLKTGKMKWSEEFFNICGFEPFSIEPNKEFGLSIIHPEDIEKATKELERAITEKSKYSIEKRIVKPSGEIRTVISEGEIICDNSNEPELLSGSFLDITERKELENKLKDAKEKAELSNKLKSEFLAQMSHEIRSPVGAILAFSNLLCDLFENKNDEILSIFEGIQNSGSRIIRTIEMLLNVSELQSGSYDFRPEKLELISRILKPLHKEFYHRAKLKNLEFKFNSEVEEFLIIGDEYSVTQIIANLLDNSIKYTQIGFIQLSVFIDNGKLAVSISDSGIGMTEKYMETIFMPFNQEDHGYSRKYEGTGLGLSLVKSYCEINKINISVKSKKNEGTTFTLHFNS